ncbi:hypothetical protein Vretifemale_152 [Volvox reticuliferus]|uniref:Uncharacterized protein n=1 Tax=Volvox reticuliferus TaxID=1737510 RepID=A0A8J4C0P9_9CHLO|nr:hypothetical protein Vretifemale_152 [Volvox reticuliferus]
MGLYLHPPTNLCVSRIGGWSRGWRGWRGAGPVGSTCTSCSPALGSPPPPGPPSALLGWNLPWPVRVPCTHNAQLLTYSMRCVRMWAGTYERLLLLRHHEQRNVSRRRVYRTLRTLITQIRCAPRLPRTATLWIWITTTQPSVHLHRTYADIYTSLHWANELGKANNTTAGGHWITRCRQSSAAAFRCGTEMQFRIPLVTIGPSSARSRADCWSQPKHTSAPALTPAAPSAAYRPAHCALGRWRATGQIRAGRQPVRGPAKPETSPAAPRETRWPSRGRRQVRWWLPPERQVTCPEAHMYSGPVFDSNRKCCPS